MGSRKEKGKRGARLMFGGRLKKLSAPGFVRNNPATEQDVDETKETHRIRKQKLPDERLEMQEKTGGNQKNGG